MNYFIRIRPEAERDVEEAFSWYEEQRSGLGREFVLELDTVYQKLQESPLLYAEIYRRVRRAVLRRFPVGVFYVCAKEEVRVLAVIHLARSPNVWQSRG
jgi:plasmid stabilization system protein ParE